MIKSILFQIYNDKYLRYIYILKGNFRLIFQN